MGRSQWRAVNITAAVGNTRRRNISIGANTKSTNMPQMRTRSANGSTVTNIENINAKMDPHLLPTRR